MRKLIRSVFFTFLFLIVFSASATASFSFSDDRFRGDFSTENMNAIIDEYELFDGWYWSTPAAVLQTYHGHPDSPGWTDTAVNKNGRTGYLKNWFGCRWGINSVISVMPGSGGYGECFGFAQFIGYLLSGDTNPQKNWNCYYSLESAQGLRVGDIIRVEYRAHKKFYHHSAVVYEVNGDEIRFLQISGMNYNKISVGRGFSDGNLADETSIEVISRIPSLKICRSPLNQ